MATIATMPAKEIRPHEPILVPEPAIVLPPSGMAGIEFHPDWPLLSRIPMRLTAAIPLPRFRVKDLVALKPGQMIASTWLSTEDIPLKIGAIQLSWSEFEVVEKRMAIRLTRLA